MFLKRMVSRAVSEASMVRMRQCFLANVLRYEEMLCRRLMSCLVPATGYTATTAMSASTVRTKFWIAASVPEMELGQLPQAP